MEYSLQDIPLVVEDPALGRPVHAVICFHYVDNPNNFGGAIEKRLPMSVGDRLECLYCEVVCSIEMDLIVYKFQDERLLHTNFIYDPCGPDEGDEILYCPVDVLLPAAITYTSEGRRQRSVPRPLADKVTHPDEDRQELHCHARLARTYFSRSGIVVWNLVLHAAEGTFHEYDLLKLMHLYEGKGEQTDLDRYVRFRVPSRTGGREREVPPHELPGAVWDWLAGEKFRWKESVGSNGAFRGYRDPFYHTPEAWRETIKPKGATLQLAMGETIGGVSLEHMLSVLYAARKEAPAGSFPGQNGQTSAARTLEQWLSREKPAEIGGILKALAGITNAIFDYKEVSEEEVIDTLDPTFASGESFIKVHRRSLINIVDSDRILDEMSDTLGISPYLMLPHSVIIHNEELIDRVDDCLNTYGESARIPELERLKHVCRKAMRSMYLPNIFNYATEKTIYERAFDIRGSGEKKRLNLERMAELDQQIEEAYEKRRNRHDVFVQALLLLLTVAQVVAIFTSDVPQVNLGTAMSLGLLLMTIGVLFIVLSRSGKLMTEEQGSLRKRG
jgi:hypothetical protein